MPFVRVCFAVVYMYNMFLMCVNRCQCLIISSRKFAFLSTFWINRMVVWLFGGVSGRLRSQRGFTTRSMVFGFVVTHTFHKSILWMCFVCFRCPFLFNMFVHLHEFLEFCSIVRRFTARWKKSHLEKQQKVHRKGIISK